MCIPFGGAALISFVIGLILQKKPTLRRPMTFFSNFFITTSILAVYFLPNIETDKSASVFHYFIVCTYLFSLSCLLAILFGVLSSAIVYIVEPKNLGIGWGVIGSALGLS